MREHARVARAEAERFGAVCANRLAVTDLVLEAGLARGVRVRDEESGQEHVVTLASEITTPKDRPISKEIKVSADDDTKVKKRATLKLPPAPDLRPTSRRARQPGRRDAASRRWRLRSDRPRGTRR